MNKMLAKRGISLIWVVIFCSLLILVATVMTSVIVMESHLSGNFDDSLQAYAAAKSGVAWGTYYVDQNGPSTLTRSFSSYDTATPPNKIADYEVTISGDTITSIGKVNNGTITRKLVYTFVDNGYDPLKVPYADIKTDSYVVSTPANESFSYQYNTWFSVGSTAATIFGISETLPLQNYIKVTINPSSDVATLTVSSTPNAGGAQVVASKSIDDLNGPGSGSLDRDFAMRATVTYHKGIGVELQMDTKDTTGARMKCHKRVMVSTIGNTLNFTDAARFYTNGTAFAPMNVNGNDVTRITNGATTFLYINTLRKKGLTVTP